MLDTFRLAGLEEILALLDLDPFIQHRPEVCDAEDAVTASEGGFEGFEVVELGLDHFHALVGEGFGFAARWVAGDAAEAVFFFQLRVG